MRLGRAWGNLSRPTQPYSTFPVTDIAFSDFANRDQDPELVVRIRLPPAASLSQHCTAGLSAKVPHFGGGLRVAGDVRRDAQGAIRDSFALSL
jgi:hypothetical protein